MIGKKLGYYRVKQGSFDPSYPYPSIERITRGLRASLKRVLQILVKPDPEARTLSSRPRDKGGVSRVLKWIAEDLATDAGPVRALNVQTISQSQRTTIQVRKTSREASVPKNTFIEEKGENLRPVGSQQVCSLDVIAG